MNASALGIARRIKAAGRRCLGPLIHWGRGRHCPVCGANLRHFRRLHRKFSDQSAAWGFPFDLRRFETLNLAEYECPVCCEADRARLIALWVRAWSTRRGAAPWRLLDFAPSVGLSRFLRTIPGVIYRSADKYMDGVDDRVDITCMPYPDGSFEGFICSHVLEHVPDDGLALRELYRVLCAGGWGLLLVPIPLDAQTTDEENPAEAKVATEASRWRRFGQGDHVRLYERFDFIRRVRTAGFTCDEFGMASAGSAEFARAGIAPGSILYVVGKPARK